MALSLPKELWKVLNLTQAKSCSLGIQKSKDSEFKRINFYCQEVYLNGENMSIETVFHKDFKFAHENEVRMCFLVCPEKLSKINQNNTKIKYYKRLWKCDLTHPEKPVVYCEEELDFAEWKKQRNGGGNDRDFFWFEAHLDVSNEISKTFTNISHQIPSQNC